MSWGAAAAGIGSCTNAGFEPRHRPGRLEQGPNLLRRRFAQAEAVCAALRTVNDPRAVGGWADDGLAGRGASASCK
jgi:hypothetical protein